MKREKKQKPRYSLGQNLVYYYKILRQNKSKVIYMVAAGIPFAIIATLLANYTPKIILDRLEFGDPYTRIAFIIVGVFAAQLLTDLVNNGVNAQKSMYTVDVFSYFSVLTEKKLLEIDYEYLEDPQVQVIKSKAHQAAAHNHTAMVNLPNTLSAFMTNLLQFVIFGGILSTLNPVIILLLIGTSFLNYLPQKLLREYTHRTKDARQKEGRKLSYFSRLSDNFGIAKDVRLYNMDSWLTDAEKAAFSRYQKLLMQLENRSFFVSLVNFSVTLLRDGAAYAYLIWRAVRGEISSGDFVLYFAAISNFSGWFTGVLNGWSALHTASLQICDFREYLEIPDKFNHGAGVPLPSEGEPLQIQLRDVSFTYPKAEKPTLTHINLTIGGGEKLAVVGLNGAGKTTLVKLICGLYTPTEGEILVNGHPIDAYNREEYYSMISAIFQFSVTLPISISENIGVCEKEELDTERLERAVRLAGLTQKISSLPLGLDTPINKTIHDNGIELSGGELQRLLLARAIYKDARLLVLDEPTAALDPVAESEVYAQYHEMAKDKTSIFISHRLASTRFCDRIILIDGGTISEEGTHDRLLARGGKYAELFHLQSQYYQEQGVTAC